MTKKELQKLIDKYQENKATPQERKLVEDWFSSFGQRPLDWSTSKRKEVRNDIFESLIDRASRNRNPLPKVTTIRSRYKRFLPYAAAIILLTLATYLSLRNELINPVNHHEDYTSIQYDSVTPLQPLLVLDNGKKIGLESHFGTLSMKNGEVLNEIGKIVVSDQDLKDSKFITLFTSNRSQYQLNLPDGSQISLNAASRISVPVIFNEHSRIVYAQGQLYFSVAKDKNKPFLVKTSQEEIKVLGTEFGIYHYPKEQKSHVSLIEGSVSVTIPKQGEKILKPNQVIEITDTKSHIIEGDMSGYIAWKNNEFVFNDRPISDVMRELSKWYGFKYDISSEAKKLSVWGTMSRKESLETNLENLQQISGIHFQIKEGGLIVIK